MGYSIGLPASFLAVILVILLLLYLEKWRHLGVELQAWRERLGITQSEAAELISDYWNKKFPNNQKHYDDRQIRRWESGKPTYPQTYFSVKQFLDDEKMFDMIAARARRDNLDALDAFMGERTPGSPGRTLLMPIEAWRAFYAEEHARNHGLTGEEVQAASQGKKKVAMMRQVSKKRRRKRKH